MKDPQLFQEFNRTATPKDLEIFDALKAAQIIENSRPKRQAGFPGATNKNDNKYVQGVNKKMDPLPDKSILFLTNFASKS